MHFMPYFLPWCVGNFCMKTVHLPMKNLIIQKKKQKVVTLGKLENCSQALSNYKSGSY